MNEGKGNCSQDVMYERKTKENKTKNPNKQKKKFLDLAWVASSGLKVKIQTEGVHVHLVSWVGDKAF